MNTALMLEIEAERQRQISKGRDAAHDDARSPFDWRDCLELVLAKNRSWDRRTWIKLASVVIAAIESFDRKAATAKQPVLRRNCRPADPCMDDDILNVLRPWQLGLSEASILKGIDPIRHYEARGAICRLLKAGRIRYYASDDEPPVPVYFVQASGEASREERLADGEAMTVEPNTFLTPGGEPPPGWPAAAVPSVEDGRR